MRLVRFKGLALAATALLSVGVMACDDATPMAVDDLSAGNDDMAIDMKGGGDMSVVEVATAQITVADVSGIAWGSVPGTDGGAPVGLLLGGSASTPVHAFAVVVDFPASAGSNQHSSGTSAIHGCSWNRYNNLPPAAGGTGPFPAPNENAGSVTITGYDTTYTRALGPAGPPLAAIDPNVNCTYNSATFHFDCYFGTDKNNLVSRYIFPPAAIPSPSPSPAPQFFNLDLFKSGNGDLMVDNSVRETFTPSPAPSTYTDMRTVNLTTLPKPPHVTSVNGVAATQELLDLTGKLDGSADVTIEYSCDATNNTKGGACQLGSIGGLLIQTSLGPKWLPSEGGNLLRFGTAQCIDADDGNGTHSFTLTAAMIKDVLGLNNTPAETVKQSIRVVLVRLKAAQTTSGAHDFFETGGRGTFAFIDQ